MKKIRKASKNEDNTFFEIFGGEYVELTTDLIIRNKSQTEDSITDLEIPLSVQGFLIEYDGTMVYLSPDGEHITQAIPFKSIKHVNIAQEAASPYDDVMDSADAPEDDRGFN